MPGDLESQLLLLNAACRALLSKPLQRAILFLLTLRSALQ